MGEIVQSSCQETLESGVTETRRQYTLNLSRIQVELLCPESGLIAFKAEIKFNWEDTEF